MSLSDHAQKSPKIYPKTAKHWPVNEIRREIWRCLKREQDIGGEAMLGDIKKLPSRLPQP